MIVDSTCDAKRAMPLHNITHYCPRIAQVVTISLYAHLSSVNIHLLLPIVLSNAYISNLSKQPNDQVVYNVCLCFHSYSCYLDWIVVERLIDA